MKLTNITFYFVIALFSVVLIRQSEAHPGISIVMDSEGTVYYTDLVHVWKITPKGDHEIAVKDVHTHELFIDDEDNLFGEHIWYEGEEIDLWGHYIWCLKKSGELIKVKDRTVGFPTNNTLTRDYEGNNYWSEESGGREILKIKTINGEIRRHTSHQFNDIRWIHVPACSNDVYVVDYLELKKVAPDGTVTTISGRLKEKKRPFSNVRDRHYIMGLWLDDYECIYVAVYGSKKIVKIHPDGRHETIYKSEKGWSPCGGLIAPDGSQWVMEFSSGNQTRVKRIEPDGSSQIWQG